MRKRLDERIPPLAGSRADLAKVPIDSILKRAMADSNEEVRVALDLLEGIHLAGQQEAGIFLLGLLVHSRDDWKRRTEIVKRLKGLNTPGCADFLLAELRGVKNNNATRQYLAAVLDVLADMPLQLVQTGLFALATDSGVPQRRRDKFTEALYRASRR